MTKDERRNQFIIVRVNVAEKQKLLDAAIQAKKQFSRFIRIKLGLEKKNENNSTGTNTV